MSRDNAPTMVLPAECCISVDTLVERLARTHEALETSNGILAFDADGTLWSGDVGNDLFYALIEAQAVREAAYAALAREAEMFAIAYSGNATEIARTLCAEYEAGTYPEERCFAMMAWVFAGMSLSDTIAFSRDVARKTNLEDRLHRFLDPVFDWSRKNHVAVWVVSASAKWMVEIGVEMFGIPNDHVIGMMPVIENEVVMPELLGRPVYGRNKPMVLGERCPSGVLLGGFGDSSYDAPMLQKAHVPVAVRPKSSLIARAHELPNLVAIGV